jgi:hypothetical protein
MALKDHYVQFSQNLKLLKALVKALPKSVPVASQSDRIFEVFSNIPVPSNPVEQFEVFNRRMDNLFGEDLRDAQGRLLNVKRGVKGMSDGHGGKVFQRGGGCRKPGVGPCSSQN